MKKVVKVTTLVTVSILVVWLVLTLWVQTEGKEQFTRWNGYPNGKNVLVVYDPDPIYNLDEQVCGEFSKTLFVNRFNVDLATVAAMEERDEKQYDVYVFCANTYNWRPDRAIIRFIKNTPLENKKTVAITLGSGSTAHSQQMLEELLEEKRAILVDSRSFWLMKPNDENRMDEPNVEVCLSMVRDWAEELSIRL